MRKETIFHLDDCTNHNQISVSNDIDGNLVIEIGEGDEYFQGVVLDKDEAKQILDELKKLVGGD
jgi:hypothetical protein